MVRGRGVAEEGESGRAYVEGEYCEKGKDGEEGADFTRFFVSLPFSVFSVDNHTRYDS